MLGIRVLGAAESSDRRGAWSCGGAVVQKAKKKMVEVLYIQTIGLGFSHIRSWARLSA
jgi:hypothetical protein